MIKMHVTIVYCLNNMSSCMDLIITAQPVVSLRQTAKRANKAHTDPNAPNVCKYTHIYTYCAHYT